MTERGEGSTPAFAAAPRWDRASLIVVVSLCALKALAHLVLVNRYGYHGDELYFLECGRHLAFGYVDHPPLIPWIARFADELGGSLIALRLPAIAAGTGTMAFTALLVREWGGGWRAQLLALLSLLVAPAHLRIAAMLDIPVVEVFLCTVAAYLVARALARGERLTWVLAGGALGLAILAKHSSVLWGGALAAGILATPSRRGPAPRGKSASTNCSRFPRYVRRGPQEPIRRSGGLGAGPRRWAGLPAPTSALPGPTMERCCLRKGGPLRGAIRRLS